MTKVAARAQNVFRLCVFSVKSMALHPIFSANCNVLKVSLFTKAKVAISQSVHNYEYNVVMSHTERNVVACHTEHNVLLSLIEPNVVKSHTTIIGSSLCLGELLLSYTALCSQDK